MAVTSVFASWTVSGRRDCRVAGQDGPISFELVIADLKSGPMAHLPSGSFKANSAWLVLAAMAFNLTRAAGCLASAFHARATTATLRAHLINVPARLAHSAGNLVLHLPERWPWQPAWEQLWDATMGAPPKLATP